MTIDRALSQIDVGMYPEALNLLGAALEAGAGRRTASARIHLARVRIRLGDGSAAAAELDRASAAEGAGNDTLPLLLLVRGELGVHTGTIEGARAAFEEAASRWTGQFPDAASVEARANAGYLDAVGDRPAQGRRAVEASLKQAQLMERLSLEARCRLLLAQIDLTQRDFDSALRVLDTIPPDDDQRTIGTELRAQVHYWRAQALIGRRALPEARVELDLARKTIDQIRVALPDGYRASFAARPDIRRIIG
jgi:predicted negative regulator of RcsB-dependent stress response